MTDRTREVFKVLKLGRKDPKQGRSKETVEAILEAVTHILNKDGAQNLTTNKIAEVAGVSVGSLYQYFKNKESIYEKILLKLLKNNLVHLEGVLNEKPAKINIRDIIELIVRTQFETLQKMDKVYSVLFQYAPKILPPSYFKQMDEHIVNFLLSKIEEYDVPIRPERKQEALYVCSNAVRSVMLMTFLNLKTEEREPVINELIDMMTIYLEVKR